MKGIAALNIYKKVALVRRLADTLTFEDKEGRLQVVSDLGEAASTSVRTLKFFLQYMMILLLLCVYIFFTLIHPLIHLS